MAVLSVGTVMREPPSFNPHSFMWIYNDINSLIKRKSAGDAVLRGSIGIE